MTGRKDKKRGKVAARALVVKSNPPREAKTPLMLEPMWASSCEEMFVLFAANIKALSAACMLTTSETPRVPEAVDAARASVEVSVSIREGVR